MRYRNERLNELAALTEGWDSYGAPSILTAALRTADALTFVPTGEGGIQIELHAGGMDIELTVSHTGRVAEVNVCAADLRRTEAPPSFPDGA